MGGGTVGGAEGGKYLSNCLLLFKLSTDLILAWRIVVNWFDDCNSFSRAAIFALAKLLSDFRNSNSTCLGLVGGF